MDQDRTSVKELREREYRMKREDAAARASGELSRKEVSLAEHLPELNRAPIHWKSVEIPESNPAES